MATTALNANWAAKTAKETTESHAEMKKGKHGVPHLQNATTTESLGIGEWMAVRVGGDGHSVRPPLDVMGSVSSEETPMITMNQIQDPWGRLATVAERYMDFLERKARANEAEKEEHDERMLTPKKASVLLHLHVQTVMAWCREGKLDAVKIAGNEVNGRGGRFLIPREAIDAYLAKQRLIHGERRRGAK